MSAKQPTAPSALNASARSARALVVTDIFMPEKEGIETIRLLRQQAPDLPILAISGSGLKDYLHFAMQLGATAALSKPFSAHQLLETVTQLVEGSPSRRRNRGARRELRAPVDQIADRRGRFTFHRRTG